MWRPSLQEPNLLLIRERQISLREDGGLSQTQQGVAAMRFITTAHLEYEIGFPSTLILNIHAQRNSTQYIVAENFFLNPYVPYEEFVVEHNGNRFIRLQTGNVQQLTIDYSATADCNYDLPPSQGPDGGSIADIDRQVIPYLFPSRYCQSDRLSRLAWDLFGHISDNYQKLTAIVDWIYNNVEYVSGSTDSETSAYDTITQRTGVCRDFAHLGIALCRAQNIPARYFSGYAYQLQPPDFHACFEAYVAGRWLVFDATRLAALNGLVRIGNGHDAAHAAVASIFGRVQCTAMTVGCELALGQNFVPLSRGELRTQGVSLEAGYNAPTY